MDLVCYKCESIIPIRHGESLFCLMCGSELFRKWTAPKIFDEEELMTQRGNKIKEVLTTCVVCGKEFTTLDRGGRSIHKTCSQKCRKNRIAVHAKKYREERKKKREVA